MPSAPTKSWMPAYLAIVLVWGLSFLFASRSLSSFTPIGVAFGRSALGASTLILVCLVSRTRLPPRALWPRLAIYALLIAVGPAFLLGIAVSHTTTSLAAIAGSTVAIWVLLVNLLFFPEQRPSASRVAGILLGFLGILIVIGVWNGVGSGTAIGIGAQLGGAILYAFSLPYAHRYLTGGPTAASVSPIALSAAILVLATIETLPLVLIFGGTHGPLVTSAVFGMLAMGVLNGGLITVLVLYLVKRTDSTTVSTAVYLTPVVATAAGIAFLGETMSWYVPVGACVVLVGAALAQGVLGERRQRAQRVDAG